MKRVKCGQKGHPKKRPDLLGLGEEALPHFSATSSDQNRAIRVESDQGRLGPHHGPLESAQGQRKGVKGVGLWTDLLDFGEQALPHFCAGTCDQDCAVWIEADEGGPRTCCSVQQSLESVQISHMVGDTVHQTC